MFCNRSILQVELSVLQFLQKTIQNNCFGDFFNFFFLSQTYYAYEGL
jgi:hypothetical protein